ncbi:hypothetical protein HHI36_018009, partial [Cryptolaemus montrouzieri]
MTMDAESFIKHIRVLRSNLTKLMNELEVLLEASESNIHEVAVAWECMKPKYEELRIQDTKVYESLLETATEEQLMAEIETCDNYIKRFTEVRLKCEKLQEETKNMNQLAIIGSSKQTDSCNAAENNLMGKRKFKLPQIKLNHMMGML